MIHRCLESFKEIVIALIISVESCADSIFLKLII